MTLDDVDSVLMMDKASHRHPWSREQYLSSVQGRHLTWVAQKANRVVAVLVASYVVDEAEVLMLTVHPDYRRQGIAVDLLDHLVVTTGCKHLFLEVRSSNQSAIECYQYYGLSEVGVRPHYYADGEDAMIMARTIA